MFLMSSSLLYRSRIPLNESCSLAALFVWKSYGGEVTRILYPGSTPQSELTKTLDQLKDLEIFKYPNGSKLASKVSRSDTTASCFDTFCYIMLNLG